MVATSNVSNVGRGVGDCANIPETATARATRAIFGTTASPLRELSRQLMSHAMLPRASAVYPASFVTEDENLRHRRWRIAATVIQFFNVVALARASRRGAFGPQQHECNEA